MSEEQGLPILPHVAGEFYSWLWWTSERSGATVDLGGDVGSIDVWVDERLAFRSPQDTRVSAVMTGENPSATLEARAALAGGKVLQDLRIGIRRDDREFFVTLKGPGVLLQQVKLPQVVQGGEEALYDRMHLYEELDFILQALFARYADARTGAAWSGQILPALRQWVSGES